MNEVVLARACRPATGGGSSPGSGRTDRRSAVWDTGGDCRRCRHGCRMDEPAASGAGVGIRLARRPLAPASAGATRRHLFPAADRQPRQCRRRVPRAVQGGKGFDRPCYDADPYDLGLHAAIANTGLLNRGVGLDLLPQIIANLFAVEPQCRRVMFDPDHRNAAARRVCEAAGCEFLGEFDMSNRRMALYAFERAAELD